MSSNHAICPDCHQPLRCHACQARAAASVTSPAKAAAARRNGKLGGWPKGKPRKPKLPAVT